MKKFITILALSTLASAVALSPITVQAAETAVVAGKTLFGANGKRIGAIYRVKKDGTVQVIRDGKMLSFPATTVSVAEGKVTTNAGQSQLADN
jgi:hypothetical protein